MPVPILPSPMKARFILPSIANRAYPDEPRRSERSSPGVLILCTTIGSQMATYGHFVCDPRGRWPFVSRAQVLDLADEAGLEAAVLYLQGTGELTMRRSFVMMLALAGTLSSAAFAADREA